MVGKFTTALAAASLAFAPIAAQAAPERTGTAVEGENLRGGGLLIPAVVLVIAALLVVLLNSDDNDVPVSP